MIRIVTWNVNSIRARIERVLNFLSEKGPDILCLQEIKCEDHQFPILEIQQLGYEAAVFGQKAYNGVAILSKQPACQVQMGFPKEVLLDPLHMEARIITATIAGLRIVNCYVPNGRDVFSEHYIKKLTWLNNLATHVKHCQQSSTENLIVLGDFNVAPEDIDCHDPEEWHDNLLFTEKEKASIQDLLSQNLFDTYRFLNPKSVAYSWWDYRNFSFQKDQGLRIDHIFASNSLKQYCVDAWISREDRKGSKPSDHAPVGLDLKNVL